MVLVLEICYNNTHKKDEKSSQAALNNIKQHKNK